MLKLFENNGIWYMELPEFGDYMIAGKTRMEAICNFCHSLMEYLIRCEHNGTLDDILNDKTPIGGKNHE